MKKMLCFEAPEEMRLQLDSVARQAGIPRSSVLRWAVRVLLERLGTHPEETMVLLLSAPGERTLESVAEEA